MQQHTKCIFRSFALPVLTFDLLKQFQRNYLKAHGIRLNNNQALTIILDEHHQQQQAVSHGGMCHG